MIILIEKEYFYASSKGANSTDYFRKHISSVVDVYALLKDSFKDILQELMEAERKR